MLLGEHAVVYGRPCLVTSVGQRVYVTLTHRPEPGLRLVAPDQGLTGDWPLTPPPRLDQVPAGARFVLAALHRVLATHPTLAAPGGFEIITRLEPPGNFGLGTSSAVTAALVWGLLTLEAKQGRRTKDEGRRTSRDQRSGEDELTGAPTLKQAFDLAYPAILDVQGRGSGFDLAAALWGGTLYFVGGGQTITPLPVPPLPLLIAFTGQKVSTAGLVQGVADWMQAHPAAGAAFLGQSAHLVETGRSALLAGDYPTLGHLFNENQALLQPLPGVSTPELERLITLAREAGAWGAKLSGAGGGDCLIALAPPERHTVIAAALTAAGAQVLPLPCGVPGVAGGNGDQRLEIGD